MSFEARVIRIISRWLTLTRNRPSRYQRTMMICESRAMDHREALNMGHLQRLLLYLLGKEKGFSGQAFKLEV